MRILVTVRDGVLEEVATDLSEAVEVVCVDIDDNNHEEPVIVNRRRTGSIPDSDSLPYLRRLDERKADRVVCTEEGELLSWPSMAWIKAVCKIGQGAACCRYLAMGIDWSCLKRSSLKALLDERAAAGTMSARGDNCEGQEEDA